MLSTFKARLRLSCLTENDSDLFSNNSCWPVVLEFCFCWPYSIAFPRLFFIANLFSLKTSKDPEYIRASRVPILTEFKETRSQKSNIFLNSPLDSLSSIIYLTALLPTPLMAPRPYNIVFLLTEMKLNPDILIFG